MSRPHKKIVQILNVVCGMVEASKSRMHAHLQKKYDGDGLNMNVDLENLLPHFNQLLVVNL